MQKIIWDNLAKKGLKEAYQYIRQHSLQNADRVKNDIIRKVKELPQRPMFYGPDKYRLNNDGSFRAFEMHSLRITYHFNENFITILMVRHTSREPLHY